MSVVWYETRPYNLQIFRYWNINTSNATRRVVGNNCHAAAGGTNGAVSGFSTALTVLVMLVGVAIVMIGLLVYNQVPSQGQLIGMALITAGVITMNLGGPHRSS